MISKKGQKQVYIVEGEADAKGDKFNIYIKFQV